MAIEREPGGVGPIPDRDGRLMPEEELPLLEPLHELLDEAIQQQNRDHQQVGEEGGLQERQFVREQEGEIEADIGLEGANVKRRHLRDERPSGREITRQVKQIRKAIRKGDEKKLNNLLSKYPNAINGSSRVTLFPLEMANCHRDPIKRQALVQTILQHNPDLTVKDRVGNTILHRLSMGGHQLLAEEILNSAGEGRLALLEMPNHFGRTPMQYAQIIGTPGMVQLYDPQGRAARPLPEGDRGHPPADRVGGPRPGEIFPAPELPPVPERMRPGELREENLLHNVRGLNLGDDLARYAERPVSVDTHDVLSTFDFLLLQGGSSAGRMAFDESGRGFMDVSADIRTLIGDMLKLESLFKLRPSQQFVFVPVALSDGRMGSLICDIGRREIEIFDSCGSGEEAVEDWGELLAALENAFEETNVALVRSMDNPFSTAIDDSGPYVLLHAQTRIQHPEFSAREFHGILEQLSAEASENPDAEKQRIESYRKDVIGAALNLCGPLHSNAFNRRLELHVSEEDWEKAERDFKNRFPLTHESERLRLAYHHLTPYDMINDTEAYQRVIAPKPLDEEPEPIVPEEDRVVPRVVEPNYRTEAEARLRDSANFWACDDDTNAILTLIFESIKPMEGDHQSIYFDCFGLVDALDFREPDFHDITSLRIPKDLNLSDDDIALLVTKLPNLRSIELKGIELKEDSLAKILGGSNNVQLALVDCRGQLGSIPSGKVNRLSIDHFEGLQDGDLAQLQGLGESGLQSVSVKRCEELKGSFIENLPESLRKGVEIYQTIVGDEALASARTSPYVTHLRLENVTIDTKALRQLQMRFKNIQSLELKGSSVEEGAKARFFRLRYPNLERLHIADTSIEAQDIGSLLEGRNIAHLELPEYKLADVLHALKSQKKLKSLSVNCEGIKREDDLHKQIFNLIQRNASLESIDLINLPEPILSMAKISFNLVRDGEFKYEIIDASKAKEKTIKALNIMGKRNPALLNEMFGLSLEGRLVEERDLEQITSVKFGEGQTVNAIMLQYIAKACPNIESVDLSTKRKLRTADLQALSLMHGLDSLTISAIGIEDEPGALWELRLLSDHVGSLITHDLDDGVKDQLRGWELKPGTAYPHRVLHFQPTEKPYREKVEIESQRPPIDRVHPSQYLGLPNLANTCFLNTTVSQFIHNENLDRALYCDVETDAQPIQNELRRVVEKAWRGTGSITRDDMERLNRAVSSYPGSPISPTGQQDATIAFDFIMRVLNPPGIQSYNFTHKLLPDKTTLGATMPEGWTNQFFSDGKFFADHYFSCGDVMRFNMRFSKDKRRGEVTDLFRQEYEKNGGFLVFPEYDCKIEGDEVVLTKVRNVRYKLDAVGIALGDTYDFGHIMANQRLPDGGTLLRNDSECTHNPDQSIDFDERALFYVFNKEDTQALPSDQREVIRRPLSEMPPKTRRNFIKQARLQEGV